MELIGNAAGNVTSPFTINKKNFALGGMTVSKSQTKDIVATAPKPSGSNLEIKLDNMLTDAVASIKIPTSAINQGSENQVGSDLRFVTVVYNNTMLFHTKKGLFCFYLLSRFLKKPKLYSVRKNYL